MNFQIKKKVKEGKVIKIELTCDDVIRNIRITGDFFLHPENMLECAGIWILVFCQRPPCQEFI